MEQQQPKFKILMFPWLAHGHISPYLSLSKILSKTQHFEVYICSTPINLHSIKSSLSKTNDHDSIKLVELHMPSTPELPPELHTTKNAPSHLVPALIQAFQESSSSFSLIIDYLKPHLLVHDLFQPWASKIALSKGVSSVFFVPVSGVPYSYYHHCYTHGDAATFPFQSIIINDFAVEQRMPIEPFIKEAFLTPSAAEFAFGNLARSTEIVLFKGCREIEGKYADHLSTLCKKKVVCIGPLLEDGIKDNASFDNDDEILKWLSGKDRNSTVYISFGSECFLSKEQISEIAKALLLCEVNFIWVLRFPKTAAAEAEELPAGFLEAVGGRGVVVEWAPQMKILAHPSVGGFVSHGGWNSLMEGIYFGVPIVAIPMQYEQPINARMVAEAGAGVEVEKSGKGCYAGEDVAEAIKKVMVEKPFCEEVRERAKLLSEKIRGNEGAEVNEVVEQLLRICRKNVKQV